MRTPAADSRRIALSIPPASSLILACEQSEDEPQSEAVEEFGGCPTPIRLCSSGTYSRDDTYNASRAHFCHRYPSPGARFAPTAAGACGFVLTWDENSDETPGYLGIEFDCQGYALESHRAVSFELPPGSTSNPRRNSHQPPVHRKGPSPA